MSDFVNTIDLLGDDVVARQLLDGSITEFKDDVVTHVSPPYFRNCANLTVIDMPNLIDITNPYDNRHFANNPLLTTVNLPKLQKVSQYMIINNASLEKIVLPSVKKVMGAPLMDNKSLRIVDFPVVENIYDRSFEDDAVLTALILRSETMATLDSTGAFTRSAIASGTGYIYVPRALVDTYKTATNWSTFANQFRALEDYTVDGTVTGELDESKI